MIRALSVDAVGTLILPDPSVGAIYTEVAADYGIRQAVDETERRFYAAFTQTRAGWAHPYGKDEADARAFWSAVIAGSFADPVPPAMATALFDTFCLGHRWRLLPGAAELFALATARALPLAVVSNFDGRLPQILDALGLAPRRTVVLSSALGVAKPHPRLLTTAAERLGVAPTGLLHIGNDPEEDGGCCAAAGCAYLPVDSERGIDLAALRRLL